jgi:rhodanese-related sulfurtransferase
LCISAGLTFTALPLTGCNTTNEDDVDDVRVAPLTASEWLRKSPERYLLLDARPPAAFEMQRIPGAEQVEPAAIDPNNIDPRFDQYKAVIVYGDTPAFGRANVVTKRLLEAGVDVYMIDGGLLNWKTQGLPVLTTDAAPTPAPPSTSTPNR